jgi:hypothetical protein
LASVSTDSAGLDIGSASLAGSFYGFSGVSIEKVWFTYGIGSPASPSSELYTAPQTDGSYSIGVGTVNDRSYQFRAKGYAQGNVWNGAILSFKSYALAATADTPTSSAVTKNSATISCTFDAKVVESTFNVGLQYRKFGDVTWISAGANVTSGGSISNGLAGLLASTTYQFQLVGSRTTANATDWSSVVSNFTTLVDAPVVTTKPATVVTSANATLNGTIAPNNVANVTVQFGWGTANGGAVLASWQNATVLQAFSGGSVQGFSQVISGLSPSTAYYFRAFVNW